jgi:4'-phosphopantetheinyl transferase
MPERLILDSARIDVWCSFIDDVDERLLEEYRSILSDSERDGEKRFRFQTDRRRYVITRALTRTTLSRYVALQPDRWSFVTNAFGQPAIANTLSSAGSVLFNISHTGGLVVLALTCDRAVGIDVENVAVPAPIEVAKDVFAATEIADLNAVPAERRCDRFYEYWTLKESYIKARGLGLSIPLDQFHFVLDGERNVRLSVSQALGDSAARWQFWQVRPSPRHLVAICAERAIGSTLQLRAVVPFGYERPMVTRASD